MKIGRLEGFMFIFLFLFLVLIYVVIGFYVKYDNEKMCKSNSVFSYKQNKKSAYVEYRQWKLVWGLLFDSQKEVNLKILDEWNNNGYTCIGFQGNIIPSVSIFKFLGIIFVTIITFGFVSFYIGPTFLFVESCSMHGIYEKESG